MKQTIAWGAALALLAGLLAGCAGKDASQSTTISSAAPASVAESESAPDSSLPEEKAEKEVAESLPPIEGLADSLTVDGWTFTLDSTKLSAQMVPEGMPEDYEAWTVKLAFTGSGEDFTGGDLLYKEGYLLAPDGEQYDIGSAMTQWNGKTEGTCTLLAGVPQGTDITRLALVYGDEKMALA